MSIPALHLAAPPTPLLSTALLRTTFPSVAALRPRGQSTTAAAVATWAGASAAKKTSDLATLGNLCVDIVLGVPELPPANNTDRKAYMERLAASPPDKEFWEAGGNCNLAIAAARLGLRCVAVGHMGDEIYGQFLLDVLQQEGVWTVSVNESNEAAVIHSALYETLLCWVLVDPFQKHGFCSRADFSDEPAFSWMKSLSEPAKRAIQTSKILLCNGYVFDELCPQLIVSALDCAKEAGTAVFFDPGPRGRTLCTGTSEQKQALHQFMRHSDVLLLTSDEAHALTGFRNPIYAGLVLIEKGIRTKWVIIKMGSKGSILISKSVISCAPSFKVNVVDTVGCGDSFTAAIAYGFLHDLPTITTLVLANAVGAATATGCGAGRNVAKLDTVLQLLKQSNLNEDDDFWINLASENVGTHTVSVVSKAAINGHSDRLICTPVQKVASELLRKFDVVCERMVS